jgi:hypothetical protein
MLLNVEVAAEIWSNIIWNTAILTYVDHYKDNEIQFGDAAVHSIVAYANNIRNLSSAESKTSFGRALEHATRGLSNSPFGLAASIIQDVVQNRHTLSRAQKGLISALERLQLKQSIMLDTLEDYDIRDRHAAICLQGLLHCCTAIHRVSNHVECILFLPGELVDYIAMSFQVRLLRTSAMRIFFDGRGRSSFRWLD